MNESVEISPVEAPVPLAGRRELRSLLTLVRREFWEHRVLWMAPVAVAVLILVGAVFARIQLARAIPAGHFVISGHIMLNGHEVELSKQIMRAIFAVTMLWVGIVEYVTMLVVLWYYAADCLFAERRDRSILFWKSMPVSDGETVLAKVLVALLVVPLAVYAISTVTTVLTAGIWSIAGLGGNLFWDTGTWLQLEGVSFVSLAVASFWYAPVTGYLMLVSALARRNVQLWVFLPPIIAMLFERWAFGTHEIYTIVSYRLLRVWPSGITGYIKQLFTGDNISAGGASLAPGPNPFHLLDPGRAFHNIDLWIGFAVGIALFAVAARIRRYRDET